MNEVEKLLHDDSKEKRSAGRAAYTKGKSHRGCTLPCDNKSNKELKKMNGEVMEMNIKEPSWEKFWEGDSQISTAVSVPILEATVSNENEGCKVTSFAVSLTNISSWDDVVVLLKSLPLPKYNTVNIDLYARGENRVYGHAAIKEAL